MKWILIITLAALFVVILMTFFIVRSKNNMDGGNNAFLNPDGNHVYYDESMIEKKEFMRKNPNTRDLRTIKRLIRLIFKSDE